MIRGLEIVLWEIRRVNQITKCYGSPVPSCDTWPGSSSLPADVWGRRSPSRGLCGRLGGYTAARRLAGRSQGCALSLLCRRKVTVRGSQWLKCISKADSPTDVEM
ncbi:hypothetical protein E2C01_059506 [Portunus trituberculatus]|uniref:Uncharacterized protein n=1 Tax=Portunus trituberculatus TaxID=210409 RepID=A0A5B7H2R3_PORTR|nr:hypothetical protein [Portunus trituberculatus]